MLEKGGRPATLFPCAPEIVACRPVLALTPIGYRWGVYHLTICPTLLGFKGASLPRFIILTSYMSASVLTAAKPSSARGGARNHPNRMTNGVSVAQCRRVTNAAYDAYARSMPLNRFISINWATAGIDDGFAATSMFVKRAGEWLSKRKIPRAYLWVRESVGGDHAHILFHVPPTVTSAFGAWARSWIRRQSPSYRGKALLTRAVGRRYDEAYSSPGSYLANLDEVIRYMLKGAVSAAASYSSERHLRWAGWVTGQRVGIARELSRSSCDVALLGNRYRT